MPMRVAPCLMAAAWLCVCSASVNAARTTLYVDASIAQGGNGTSWASAYRDLQAAIAVATSDTDLWIADGTYVPTTQAGPRTASFVLPAGARMYGGFKGTETLLSQRDPVAYPTVLSGEIGSVDDPNDNCYHVLRLSAGTGCVVDSVIITRGSANGLLTPDDSGGGAFTDGNPTTFNNVTFLANTAKLGAGSFARNAVTTYTSCSWRQNVSTQDGGGAVVRGGGSITDCLFDGNSAIFGGGLLTCCTALRIERSEFRGNFGNRGGGIYTTIGALTVSQCGFANNAASDGGAIFTSASGNSVLNSRFAGNTAVNGGAVYTTGGAGIANSAFSRNFASSVGGAVYNSIGNASIINCTLWSNNAATVAGGVYVNSGSPVIRNTILWANHDGSGWSQAAQVTRGLGTLTMSHCCVQGWNGSLGGAGNHGVDPRFLDPDGPDNAAGTLDDDFHLAAGSSCIDAADKSVLPADVTDLDHDSNTNEAIPVDLIGCPRVEDDIATPNTGPGAAPTVDIGAVEFSPSNCAGDANGDLIVNGADLSVLLGMFGSRVTPGTGADFNGDGAVNAADLSVMLSAFGTIC